MNKSIYSFRKRVNGKRVVTNYRTYLDFLKKAGIIEINERFSNGAFSKSYRVKFSILRDSYTTVELDLKKILNIKDDLYWVSRYPKISALISNHYKLNVDLNRAYTYLLENRNMELEPKNGKRRFLTDSRIHRYFYLLTQFSIQNLWFKLSNEGRLYSSLTNLPSILRKFITMDGDSLFEIDVKNCAPLLLNQLVDNSVYKEDCENGMLYDNIASKISLPRSRVKQLMCEKFFFANRKMKSGQLFNALSELYGADFIEQINSMRQEYIDGKDHLACALQRLESDIIINKLAKIKNSYLPIHDAILVLEEDIESFFDIIKELFLTVELKVRLRVTKV